MKKKQRTIEIEVTFERTDDTARRLPVRADMIAWMRAAADRDLIVGVRFVGPEEGRELNAQYRGKDYATNILTFDYTHEPTAEADLVVCTDVVRREAAEQGKSFRAHLAHLLVHGVLHA